MARKLGEREGVVTLILVGRVGLAIELGESFSEVTLIVVGRVGAATEVGEREFELELCLVGREMRLEFEFEKCKGGGPL